MSFETLGADSLEAAPREGQAKRPNIVMIFTDDQGWNDVGCYGSEIPTPNIDRLAKEGVKLTQFYAASSICTPSRFGLLTGRFPTRSRDGLLSALMFLSDEDKQRGLRNGEVTYVERLAAAGYATALVGKWHLGHGDQEFWPTQHGFQTFFGHTGGCVDFFSLHYGTKPDWYRNTELVFPKAYATDAITNECLAFLKTQSSGDRPFYLHVAYNAPHFGKAGNMETGEIVNKMQPRDVDLARVPDHIAGTARRAFAAKVIGMDDGIGAILDELDSLGLTENTLVVFMTDHGGDPVYGGNNMPLRGGKATLFEGGIRVPCLIRWPNQVEAGSESDMVLNAIDFFPSLCSAAGAEFQAAETDGINLFDSLSGVNRHETRDLLWYTGAHNELDRKSWIAFRRGRWKIVDPPTEDLMLFDLRADPNEATNVAARFPDRALQLSEKAHKMLQEHRGALERKFE